MRLARSLALAVVAPLVAAATAGPARAGRTPFGWVDDTEVLPERGAEIQTWISEENGKSPGDVHDTTLLWSALVGVTDRLELGLPIEALWRESAAAPGALSLQRLGLEARYRFASPDPVEAPAVVPLVRAAIKRDVVARERVRIELDGVVSYRAGRVHAVADVGIIVSASRAEAKLEVRPAAGVSVAVVGDLRLGAEAYAELKLDSDRDSWVIAGPSLGWTHGRLWVSAALGVGLYRIDTAPRVIWGILF